MKYIKLADFEANETNPFIKDLEIDKGKKYLFAGNDKEQIIVNPDTGEETGAVSFMKIKTVDKEQFVKMYVTNLSSMFNLKPNAVKVFAYILSICRPNSDLIYFSPERAMAYTGYTSRATVLNGLAQLMKMDFVAKSSERFLYFINPSIFFNGDRISFIKSYRLQQGKLLDKNIEDAGKAISYSEGKQ